MKIQRSPSDIHSKMRARFIWFISSGKLLFNKHTILGRNSSCWPDKSDTGIYRKHWAPISDMEKNSHAFACGRSAGSRWKCTIITKSGTRVYAMHVLRTDGWNSAGDQYEPKDGCRDGTYIHWLKLPAEIFRKEAELRRFSKGLILHLVFVSLTDKYSLLVPFHIPYI